MNTVKPAHPVGMRPRRPDPYDQLKRVERIYRMRQAARDAATADPSDNGLLSASLKLQLALEQVLEDVFPPEP